MAERDQVLAKAAEAVREWLEKHICSGCLSQVSCKHCHAGTVMHRADDLARAVLEAAGVEVLRTDIDEDSLPMVAFRLDQRRVNGRWLVRVFAGPDMEHLDFAGELLLRPSEWYKLALMLTLSAPEVPPIHFKIAKDESQTALQRAGKEE